MIENFNDLYLIILKVSIIFLILMIFYRRKIFSFFDPLFFYLITQAFSIELGILQINNTSYFISFILAQLFFMLGFCYFAKNINRANLINDIDLTFSGKEYQFWAYFTIISFFIVLFANLYFYSVKGIILFGSDATTGKVSAFQGGGGIGIVRRINWGLKNLLIVSTIFLFLKRKKNIYLIMFLVLFLITISGGSKSGVIIFIILLSILGQLKSIKLLKSFKKIDKLKVPILFFGIFLSLFILAKNNTDVTASILALGVRFLYYGDIIFYYYNQNAVSYFQQLGFFDFFKYELNPIFGLFRLTEYLEPLGFKMVEYTLPVGQSKDIITGPNLPYYVKGHIFFGKYGSLIYSFVIGIIIALVRNRLFFKKMNFSMYIIFIYLNLNIFTLAQDSALLLSKLFDTLVLGFLPFVIALLFTHHQNISKTNGHQYK